MYLYIYIYISIYIYPYIKIYIYIYIYTHVCVVLGRICDIIMNMWAGTVRTVPTQCPHSAHTVPTQCPPQCPLGNRRVFGVWTEHKNIEGEGSFSSFMLKLQMLDDSQSGHCGGHCVGTVWALCGHCVDGARPMPTHCPHNAHTLPATVPTWESSSIWTLNITQEY